MGCPPKKCSQRRDKRTNAPKQISSVKNLCSPPNAVAGDGGRKIKQTMGLNQKSVDRENAANTGNRGGKSGQ